MSEGSISRCASLATHHILALQPYTNLYFTL